MAGLSEGCDGTYQSDEVDHIRWRLCVGDSDRHGRKPLHLAIVELLYEESVSGATVLHGIEGYGAHKQIHTARILDLSGDLPVLIVAVDLPEKIEAVLPKLDEMIGGGLVTTEDVRIVISRPPPQP